jgi:hypothetical protein
MIIDGIVAGTTSFSDIIMFQSRVTGLTAANITTAYYWRQGGSQTAISVTDLASLTGAFYSGGWYEQADGAYRFDYPNAMFAAGATWVALTLIADTGDRFDYRWSITDPAAFATVAALPTTYSPSTYLTSDVLDGVRSLLNDPAATMFTDAMLLPFVNHAYQDLTLALENNDIPLLDEVSSAITVIAGATTLTAPVDMLFPLKLQERIPGGSTTDWIDMERVRWESDYIPQSTLCFWSWRGITIFFPGATGTREVRIYYRKILAPPTTGSVILPMAVTQSYLEHHSAELVASRIMQDTNRATMEGNDAKEMLATLINILVKQQQKVPVRRRGFMTNFRTRRIFR